MRLYDYPASCNCYKVRLLLAQLGLHYERVPVDIFAGETLTAAFAAVNPARTTPVLETGDGRRLPESAAILTYLASGTPLYPEDAFERAEVIRWLVYEQTDVIPAIAGLRFRLLTGRLAPSDPDAVDRLRLARGRPAAPGRSPRRSRVPRRRPLHDRRHRPLRLHPPRARGGHRPRAVRRRHGLARARRRPAGLHGGRRAVWGKRGPRRRHVDLRLRPPTATLNLETICLQRSSDRHDRSLDRPHRARSRPRPDRGRSYRAISAGLEMAEDLHSAPMREASAAVRARIGAEFRRQPHLALVPGEKAVDA